MATTNKPVFRSVDNLRSFITTHSHMGLPVGYVFDVSEQLMPECIKHVEDSSRILVLGGGVLGFVRVRVMEEEKPWLLHYTENNLNTHMQYLWENNIQPARQYVSDELAEQLHMEEANTIQYVSNFGDAEVARARAIFQP